MHLDCVLSLLQVLKMRLNDIEASDAQEWLATMAEPDSAWLKGRMVAMSQAY